MIRVKTSNFAEVMAQGSAGSEGGGGGSEQSLKGSRPHDKYMGQIVVAMTAGESQTIVSIRM